MERARENVAILLNDLWHSAVIDYGFVRSKIIWNKFRFSRVKICVVVGYVPSEGDGKERDNMDRILDRVGNGYRLCILADLNGWIGDRMRAGITRVFGVPGVNNNGKRVVEFCAERGLCVANTYFKHRSFYKYTRVPNGVEAKNMIDLVFVKKDILLYVQDVRAV